MSKPVFKYVRIDETKYWNEKFVAGLGEGAKLIATYIYDETERTFCCELTPSHWLEYCGTQAEPGRELSEEELEETYNYIMEGDFSDETGHYRHCSSMQSLDPKPVPPPRNGEWESLEEVVEHYHGNPW